MGASVEIFGVTYKKLIEDHPGYFKSSQEVSVVELYHMYYESLFEKVYGKIDCGLELFYANGIKRYCFTLYEMMAYCFSSFNWHNRMEMEVESHDSHHKLTKDQVIDLMDWYIALTFVFSDDNYVTSKIKEPKYLEEAKLMIDYFESTLIGENYFKISGFDFVELKEEFVNSHYDCYFYTYSV